MADATHRLALILEARNQASKELQNVRKDLGGVGAAASGLGRGLSSVMPGLNTILGMAGIAGGAWGAWKLAEQAIDLSKMGAAADRAAEAFERRLGGDATAALEKMRAASQGTIADMDLMAAATKAQMLGVADDSETLAGLLEVAARRGRDLGMSTADAFSDIVTGIGRLSPMILDNLGIVMDAKGTYEAYAQALGKSADALTDMEKRQALVNRVLQEATGDPGELDAAGQWEAQAASLANLKTEFGKLMSEMVTDSGVISDLTTALQDATAELAAYRAEQERITDPAKEFDAAISQAVEDQKLGANVAEMYRRELGLLMGQYRKGTLSLDEYSEAVGDLHYELIRVYELRDEPWPNPVDFWPDIDEANRALGRQIEQLYQAHDAAWLYAQALGMVADEAFLVEATGAVRRPIVSVPAVGAAERYEFEQRQLEEAQREAERAAETHANEMERLYEEQQASLRSMAESILTPTAVTPADMFRAQTGALGGYVEKWDESARRLQDIANRGAASPWWEILEIPAEVLAQGEDAVRIWAQETADAVQRGVRPDLIDWEAFDRAAEEFVRDQEARERTVAMAMERLGGGVAEADVRQMLGVPADATEEALAVGEAFQQGLGAVDLGRALTERFHEQMLAQVQRWVTMGSMTAGWFAQGLEEGVGDETGLRIAKKLWPMIAPMIDNYLARGVWN